MQTTFLSKKGFKELHREVQQLKNEVKSITKQIKDLGRVKTHDDKLWRSDLVS